MGLRRNECGEGEGEGGEVTGGKGEEGRLVKNMGVGETYGSLLIVNK